MREILEKLKSLPDVFVAMIIEEDGLLVDSISDTSLDPEAISGLCATIFRTAKTILTTTHLGELDFVTLESERGNIFIKSVGELFLAVVARKRANLGLIRVVLRKNAERLKEYL
ncbi:MAG: hypothetical protein DRI22_03105 [Caldiserica bacterium]|mgnify:CR=1 FL=1|nr:MAG: hypothetical protein DRI28_03975 [Caldisericota bacterium]RLD14600.1 MAG: hypothetical protein DRI22_03105 [Caldisericota bacterium]HDL50501.1 hypothetical protein [Bacillota bacterium]